MTTKPERHHLTAADAYLQAVEFTDLNVGDEFEDKYFAPEVDSVALQAVLAFLDSLPQHLSDELDDTLRESPLYGWAQLGHDLWLTRNGHGTGFWDRLLGELGDGLSDYARAMGESYVELGEDDLIYLS